MVKDAQLGTERSVMSEDTGIACSGFLSWGPRVVIQDKAGAISGWRIQSARGQLKKGGHQLEKGGHQLKKGGVHSTFYPTWMAQKGGVPI